VVGIRRLAGASYRTGEGVDKVECKVKKKRQPIADKVLQRIEKEMKRDVIDLSSVRAGKKQAADLQATIKADDFAELPPAYAVYMWVQNQITITAEQLLGLKAMYKFADVIEESQELYTPMGPPISPITASYYSFWSLFDVAFGLGKETLGSVAIAVSRRLGAHNVFIELATKMAESRCGVYQIVSSEQGLITVKELWTQEEIIARNASGYNGEVGEIWYTRIFPPNELEQGVSVVANTPYVMYQTSVAGWMKYFDDILDKGGNKQSNDGYHDHMKYGDGHFYWPEYIFEAYVNHTSSHIFSKGLPNIPESRPHSELYEEYKTW